MFRPTLPCTPNGIFYKEQDLFPDGVSFVLFAPAETPADDLLQAKAFLRDTRDVVGIKVAKEADWIDQYRREFFCDPRVRDLKWYQVNDDNQLVRAAVRQGLSPADYVTTWVIPCSAYAESKNMSEFGSVIYTF